MHIAYLCCFQVIWSCWRANWKKRTWSCQTTWPSGRVETPRPQQSTRPPGRVGDFTNSSHHSTPWSSTTLRVTRSHHSITSVDHLVEYLHLHHLTITRSPHSTNHSTNVAESTIIVHWTNHSTNRSSITIIIHSTNHSTNMA